MNRRTPPSDSRSTAIVAVKRRPMKLTGVVQSQTPSAKLTRDSDSVAMQSSQAHFTSLVK